MATVFVVVVDSTHKFITVHATEQSAKDTCRQLNIWAGYDKCRWFKQEPIGAPQTNIVIDNLRIDATIAHRSANKPMTATDEQVSNATRRLNVCVNCNAKWPQNGGCTNYCEECQNSARQQYFGAGTEDMR